MTLDLWAALFSVLALLVYLAAALLRPQLYGWKTR